MIHTWPAELPRPERNSWSAQHQEARQKRQNEAGPPGYRRKFSSVAKMVGLSVMLSRSNKAVFDRFYQRTTGFGSALFWMPDPTTDGWPMLTSSGAPVLAGNGQPLLLAARWLCSFGDTVPTETVVGVEFRMSFSVVVMP